ncbi:hypothetical protein OLEAN_C09570 [Oleispira antarctica RB-8]|uniref:Uncharacterized protein n=1 Tax=Oleispira antarctica RB-8 TaxID=698738 RepID=R4YPH1_OLEAN|nr:hypothetical protein OLEAN_C09570 [Oleispira antarctica RB-8]
MAEKIIRKVRKLITFFSPVSTPTLLASISFLNIKYFNANPKLIQMSNINITTNQAIQVFIGFLHEN